MKRLLSQKSSWITLVILLWAGVAFAQEKKKAPLPTKTSTPSNPVSEEIGRRLRQISPVEVELWQAAYYKTGEDFRRPYCEWLLAEKRLEQFRVDYTRANQVTDTQEYAELAKKAEENPRDDRALLDYCMKKADYPANLFQMPTPTQKIKTASHGDIKLRAVEQYTPCTRDDVLTKIARLHAPDFQAENWPGASQPATKLKDTIPMTKPFKAAVKQLEKIQSRCEKERAAILKHVIPDKDKREAFIAKHTKKHGDNYLDKLVISRLKPTRLLEIHRKRAAEKMKHQDKWWWLVDAGHDRCEESWLEEKAFDQFTCDKDRYALKSSPASAEAINQFYKLHDQAGDGSMQMGFYVLYPEFIEKEATFIVRELSTTGSSYIHWLESCDECEGGGYKEVVFNANGDQIAYFIQFTPACPFVYTPDMTTASGWRYRGEILRNLHNPYLESSQQLDISVDPALCEEPSLKVRMTEEKSETTSLDSVRLRAGDVALLPLACVQGQASAYCEDDATYHTLEQGDAIEFEFMWTPSSREACRRGHLSLEANGYYVPHMSSSQN